VLNLFIALCAFGGGGNLVLDTTVFLEYLPGRYQWMLTAMALWWGVGYLFTGLFAWALLPRFSCDDAATCTRSNNMGWRYVWLTSGSFVLLMSILRVTVVRLQETPKYLLGEGKDHEVINTLQNIAQKYNRPYSLTVEKLQACGTKDLSRMHARRRISPREIWGHICGLFETRRMAISTALIWLSWTMIGLAYPLFNIFLPSYLESRGAKFGKTSSNVQWRDYTIINVSGLLGPIPAGFM